VDILYGRRFMVLIRLLKSANQNHGTNIVESNSIKIAGKGKLLLMLNHVRSKLLILLSLL
jgi:hypothetical protein